MSSIAEAEVRAALAAWLRAFNEKDAVSFFDLYDPQVAYANAGAPLRRGVDEVRASFEGALNDPTVRLRFKEETLFAGPELALIAGNYHFDLEQEDGSLEPGSSGRVALLYRKATDGRWLLAYDMDNAPPDAAGLR